MQTIFITGATGFVGRCLVDRLTTDGWSVTAAVRTHSAAMPDTVKTIRVENIAADTDWLGAFAGIETLVHLAARAHVIIDRDDDPLAAFRRVNVAGTERLAREAAKAGVQRFIFVSSIKVNGEGTDTPYSEAQPVHPSGPYGISKWEAEQALRRIETETAMKVVIIRPPLVYGPGVKANFLNLIKIVNSGIPLPLASVSNKRSLIYIENLVDAIVTCIRKPGAAGQTYLVSDGEDVSTPELARRLASALERPARLFPFPAGLLRIAGKLAGKSGIVDRLIGSLLIDSSKIHRDLGWKPPCTMELGLKRTAGWFLKGFGQ
jgi:nucleoside-diphosphate-sugar epimerase